MYNAADTELNLAHTVWQLGNTRINKTLTLKATYVRDKSKSEHFKNDLALVELDLIRGSENL